MTRINFKLNDYKNEKAQTTNLGFFENRALNREEIRQSKLIMPSFYLCIVLYANGFCRFSPKTFKESI